ncbi:anaerobic sulfatase maturase [Pelagicoccus albus]|uniref:Anaerobic sulfatase maturase n=2 Tax=Pelagicoccus albus TaxID=415222 RepID=A0A7X1B7F5_9BACT|nr:anaerobic sulfatase maturase [Pelagicoccus albus]
MRSQAQRPFHVMTKPIGPICNLDCKYCFYLEKEALYTEKKWRMQPDVLENYIRQYIEAQPNNHVSFAWQGGEPTLLGVDYFRRVVDIQNRYANGKSIENAFQTNGTLLDADWARFLKQHDFLVGVSIDGPKDIHDANRVDKRGESSFDQVMRGIQALQDEGVRFNTLTCLNRVTSQKPLEVYRFLKSIGSEFMQFIPIVERRPGSQAREWGLDLAEPGEREQTDLPVFGWSVLPKDFGDFYIRIFDRWIRKDVGKVYIQMFETAFAKWVGIPGGICVHSETCGDALAIEHNGDVYSCDHFVYPQYRLGNMSDHALVDMVESDPQRKFGNAKRDTLPKYCRDCNVRFACNGGCPKDRFLRTPDGEAGLHYLCLGYRKFFQHIDVPMRAMAGLYSQRRPIPEIMELVAKKKLPGYKALR